MADRKAVRAGRPPRTILSVRLRSGQPGSAASIVRCSGCRTASFSVADGLDAIGRDSRLHRRFLHGFRAVGSESDVVFLRTAIVGVAFDENLDARMLRQEGFIVFDSWYLCGTDPARELDDVRFYNCGSSPSQRVAHPVGRRLGAELDYALFCMPRHGASWLSSWMEL